MLWIGAGNNVDSTEKFSLLLSSAHIEPKPLLPHIPPTSKEAGDAKHLGGGTGGTPIPAAPRDVP